MTQEEQKVQELLKPRYKVIADYPGSDFTIGDIINPYLLKLEEFPHLFRKLEWHEERKLEEMPEYVKDERDVYKVKEWHTDLAPICTVLINPKVHKGYIEDCTQCPLYSEIKPATDADYHAYISSTELK